MRIAIASVYLGQVRRGVESWARDLAAELYRRGMDVTLFKGGGPPEAPYERQVWCVDHTGAWAKRFTRFGGWRLGLGSPEQLQQNTFAWSVARRLRAGRYDVVHTQDAKAARLLESLRRWGFHGARVILGHGTSEALEYLLHFEHVQELSPQVLAEDYARGVPATRRWFAIPNFVDCERFAPGDQAAARREFGLPAEAPIVLESAALKISQKRLDHLIREFREAKRSVPNLELVIAGASGPETPQVEVLAGAEVRLLKNVPPERMPVLYRVADVFAHPALREPMGIAFLEALASGVPCLGHHFPVTQWVIGPGGRTLDMEKPGQLAAALCEYAQDRDRCRREGRAGREHVLREFETRRVVDQMVAMYEAVLAA